ncbi:aminopeptidase O-like isoform X1 [Acipenser oxyrinchus oxyrinchus]|uniref:Aminopeptidase O n=1 Tax=Acipenser oxyrinchus oxyrinchus TaxID=40147 RepID=A0AAD8GKY0_ACIOX|nr:aminopeptidase O-like isoform X1 [Acipenser oxyrinchus oxyrinchus]
MQNDMEPNLDPSKDDLPLRANTNHMLVRHYVLDLAVHFQRKVISGNIVLFFESRKYGHKLCNPGGREPCVQRVSCFPVTGTYSPPSDANNAGACGSGGKDTDKNCNHGNMETTSRIFSSKKDCRDTAEPVNEDFVLVLDCCDLSVLKVEEVDATVVPGMWELDGQCTEDGLSQELSNRQQRHALHKLETLPARSWREQHDLFLQCSRVPGCGELPFEMDSWSLQIRKPGIKRARYFPHLVRIWYETKPDGASVRWTKDQSTRPCVYTMGSPINNRALFPCQEPPVAMSTWQANIQAPEECLVLLSGENTAEPVHIKEGVSSWFYYVTMPMPASTFTIAVGHWIEAKLEDSFTSQEDSLLASSAEEACSSSQLPCSHMDYPCRFQKPAAQVQAVIPHRVFAPHCLKEKSQEILLPLLPHCLTAAHSVLGTHPFPRLDVLLVPAGFSSLGMASPHIMFLSQSVLAGKKHLCGARLCHEIAHAWFGLAIGAQDWTEEWISEGFATFFEDVFWTNAQKLPQKEAREQYELKALLRWRRLREELQNSEEELQVLRPNREQTGEVSPSGASLVKHGLNPSKFFMQVHYLKGYFLLRFLASKIGEEPYLKFFRLFVQKTHGQLILSQDFLHMLLEKFPEIKRQGLTLDMIYEDWLDSAGIPKPLLEESKAWLENQLVEEVKREVAKWIQFNQRNRKGTKLKRRAEEQVIFKEVLPDQLVLLLEFLLEEESLSVGTLRWLERRYSLCEQDAEVRHRWCELIVKHKHTAAYKDVEQFLKKDQAMGVYLYGELMVHEDARQQGLAKSCFRSVHEEMDPTSKKVVEEMIL